MIGLQPYLPNLATVLRRTGGASGDGAYLDVLNAQAYGDPTAWTEVYVDMPCRFEVKTRNIDFTPLGERTNPSSNVLYISPEYSLETEDRVVIDSITYIVQGIMIAYNPIGGVHHYEVQLIVEP